MDLQSQSSTSIPSVGISSMGVSSINPRVVAHEALSKRVIAPPTQTVHAVPVHKHLVEDAVNPSFSMRRQQKSLVSEFFGPGVLSLIAKPAADKSRADLETILGVLKHVLRLDQYDFAHALEIARIATIARFPANAILQQVHEVNLDDAISTFFSWQ